VNVYETPKFYIAEMVSLYEGEDSVIRIPKSECAPFPKNPLAEINPSGTTELD
jgi:hypothetical protein